MAIADDRHEHFGMVHILRDLNARHRGESEPHIAHVLRNNLGKRALQSAIDPPLSFAFHRFDPNLRRTAADSARMFFTMLGLANAASVSNPTNVGRKLMPIF